MAHAAVLSMRREAARAKRRRDDMWVASTAMLAALVALPLAQSAWQGPEVAAVLAVAATALFAGQRWAIAVIVIAQLMLVPTVLPRAFFASDDLVPRVAALVALIASVPGMLSMRRAAAALVVVTGQRRTQRVCRRFHAALVAIGVVGVVLPLI